MGALSCRSVARGCALALSVAVADRPLLRRSRLEAHRRGGPAGGERGQQFLRRERADEGAAARRQGPLLRPLDRSEQWTRVWAKQRAIPHALPGERRGPHAAAGECPSSRPRRRGARRPIRAFTLVIRTGSSASARGAIAPARRAEGRKIPRRGGLLPP